jgi:hypothetical protein
MTEGQQITDYLTLTVTTFSASQSEVPESRSTHIRCAWQRKLSDYT